MKRKLLQPSFKFSMIEKFVSVMNEQSQIFINILDQKGANGGVFDIAPLINHCTLDIIIGR